MIEDIVFIEALIMCTSIIVASVSLVIMCEMYNKFRYDLDKLDNNKMANALLKVFIASASVAIVSWLSIFVTGIIDIATK